MYKKKIWFKSIVLKKKKSQKLCNKSQVYYMPYLHTYKPHSIWNLY
jgi:hypothetical protein